MLGLRNILESLARPFQTSTRGGLPVPELRSHLAQGRLRRRAGCQISERPQLLGARLRMRRTLTAGTKVVCSSAAIAVAAPRSF